MYPMEVASLKNQGIPIHAGDSSQAGQARRWALEIGNAMEFGEVRLGELAIIVTEAANNIAAHARAGEIILSPWIFEDSAGIDVFALDRGPGIADIGNAFEDGYSTAGTAGAGMGAMSRLAGSLQIYSLPNGGTALFARVFREGDKSKNGANEYGMGAINLPYPGESVCGDAWSFCRSEARTVYMVADGLGHGPLAAEASQEAIRIFQGISEQQPERILMEIHDGLRKTRGAAVAVAEILHQENMVNYVGAGNISASIHTAGKTRNMISLDGTVGHSVAKFQTWTYPWDKNSLLIMHSDGLTALSGLEPYPGLASRHPALIAAILYRDFRRRNDDATVLVSRGLSASGGGIR